MDRHLPEKFVITIGRSFGSGGRELGRLVAEKLGIAFYDKELLVRAAEKAGMSPEYFERNDERMPTFFSGLLSFSHGYNPMAYCAGATNANSDGIYQAQSEFIHELAAHEACVIVGRSADYILRDVPNVVNIFVHAPMEARVRRIVARADSLDSDSARTLAEKTDRLRSNFYNFYTDKRWGAARSYDLSVDSTVMPIDQLADFVIDFVCRKLSANRKEQ